MHNHIDGRLWISKAKQNFLGRGRIELLEHIHQTGSISGAAKIMKMSYKAAWDAIDAINKLSEEPLVERSTGGKGGGGTRLTPKGLEYITLYKKIEHAQHLFFETLEHYTDDNDKFSAFISKLTLRTSARNQLLGTVLEIKTNKNQAKLIIKIDDKTQVAVIITKQSLKEMDIQKGAALYVLLKAAWISLFKTKPAAPEETKNYLNGTITCIEEDEAQSEVTVLLEGKQTLIASIPTENLREQSLALKDKIWASFDISNALLAI
ncbi:MAG TPA: molybdenum-dependent transcriptional regulator [Sulfurovum sp. UBA12169]|nr:MAG TPA: molybdenum-dependent transcriptional regulator [Sulfurovum sp. UBA12169]